MVNLNKRFRVGFHWGTVEGNGYLLFAGGWAAPMGSHFYELSDGRSAVLTPAVMQQVRHWYRLGGKTDIAGAGLYFSTDLFAERNTGGDLLILHFHAEHLEDWDPDTFQVGNLKNQADQALSSGTYASLPLMSCFAEPDRFVIYRAQGEGRNSGVRVYLHPPSAEDVIQIWRMYTKGKSIEEKCQFFSQLASMIVDAKRPTRPAEILYHRLLCDHSTETMLRFSVDEWDHLAQVPAMQFQMPQIVLALRTLMPTDQRTRSISQQWDRAKGREPKSIYQV